MQEWGWCQPALCIPAVSLLSVVAIYDNANAIGLKRLVPGTNTSLSGTFLLVGAEE